MKIFDRSKTPTDYGAAREALAALQSKHAKVAVKIRENSTPAALREVSQDRAAAKSRAALFTEEASLRDQIADARGHCARLKPEPEALEIGVGIPKSEAYVEAENALMEVRGQRDAVQAEIINLNRNVAEEGHEEQQRRRRIRELGIERAALEEKCKVARHARDEAAKPWREEVAASLQPQIELHATRVLEAIAEFEREADALRNITLAAPWALAGTPVGMPATGAWTRYALFLTRNSREGII
jgi:chromosome segregation ATPase